MVQSDGYVRMARQIVFSIKSPQAVFTCHKYRNAFTSRFLWPFTKYNLYDIVMSSQVTLNVVHFSVSYKYVQRVNRGWQWEGGGGSCRTMGALHPREAESNSSRFPCQGRRKILAFNGILLFALLISLIYFLIIIKKWLLTLHFVSEWTANRGSGTVTWSRRTVIVKSKQAYRPSNWFVKRI